MAENYFLGWSIDLVRNADWISIWAGQGGPEGILFTVCRAELGHIISFVRLQQKNVIHLKIYLDLEFCHLVCLIKDYNSFGITAFKFL